MNGDPPRRVWVDLTNSPHVLVLAPIVRRLRAAGHEVSVTARDFAQTIELAERHGLGASGARTSWRGGPRRPGARARVALAGGLPVRARPRLRRGRRTRLERPAGRRSRTRHPRGRHVRLRVGVPPAHGRLPAVSARAGARRDPARAAAALRRERRRSSVATRDSRRSTTSPTSSPTRTRSPRSVQTGRGSSR